VQVDGSVAHPGIYQLPAGSRVQDGILAAGGCGKNADTSMLNLAARLKDGEKIVVPEKGTPAAPAPARTRTVAPPRVSATPAVKGGLQVNINRASAAELETLPGIGPYLAQQIITYRQAHGPFKRIEDILDVPGIGPKTFEKIKNLISI
jgi:competence protein ComEA